MCNFLFTCRAWVLGFGLGFFFQMIYSIYYPLPHYVYHLLRAALLTILAYCLCSGVVWVLFAVHFKGGSDSLFVF